VLENGPTDKTPLPMAWNRNGQKIPPLRNLIHVRAKAAGARAMGLNIPMSLGKWASMNAKLMEYNMAFASTPFRSKAVTLSPRQMTSSWIGTSTASTKMTEKAGECPLTASDGKGSKKIKRAIKCGIAMMKGEHSTRGINIHLKFPRRMKVRTLKS
jgi:hypothetical protein